MIHVCPVKDCGIAYEAGEDHHREPCASCWRLGWRSDACGNVWRETQHDPPGSCAFTSSGRCVNHPGYTPAPGAGEQEEG